MRDLGTQKNKNMNIINYVPVTTGKQKFLIGIVLVAIISIALNTYLFRMFYVVRCFDGIDNVGYLMTKEQCGLLDDYHTAYTTQNDATIYQNNPDMQ